jgi:MarR family transcriptional regulator, lower aerobic nicotinate degradation pathway regulator
MAADRRTPVTKEAPETKGAKPVRKTPANAAAVSAVAAASKAPALKPAKGDYALEEQVGFHLRRAHQRATLIFNEVMARFDITPTQFAALAKIDDEGAISQNHLGRLTAMDPSTILGVVGRLQRQGLVHLKSTPGDARLTLIELTLDGQRRVAEMKAVAADVSKQTLSPLKPAEAKTLNELLARIC